MTSCLRVLRDAHEKKKEYGVTILGNQAILCSLISMYFFSFVVYFLHVVASVKALYDCILYSIFTCHYIVHSATIIFISFQLLFERYVECRNCARVVEMKWTCADFC